MVSFFSGVRFVLRFEKGCHLNCYRISNNVCNRAAQVSKWLDFFCDCLCIGRNDQYYWSLVGGDVSGHAQLSTNLHLARCGNWRTFMVACMVCFPTTMGFKASVHVGIHFGWWNLSLKAVLVSRVPIGFFGSFILLFIMVLETWFVFFQKHMDSVIN
jgi:hypothetical protein